MKTKHMVLIAFAALVAIAIMVASGVGVDLVYMAYPGQEWGGTRLVALFAAMLLSICALAGAVFLAVQLSFKEAEIGSLLGISVRDFAILARAVQHSFEVHALGVETSTCLERGCGSRVRKDSEPYCGRCAALELANKWARKVEKR